MFADYGIFVLLVCTVLLGGCLREFDRSLIPGQQVDNDAFVSITAGSASSCAVHRDGRLWCWGRAGSLGVEVGGSSSEPVLVVGDWVFVKMSRTFEAHACGITRSGALHCWGSGSNGELGDGERQASDTPVEVGTQTDWVSAHGGAAFQCGLRGEGEVYCWGWSSAGRLGFFPPGSNQSTPERVPLAAAVRSFDVNVVHAIALDEDGGVWSWGTDSDDGRLGRDGPSGTAAMVQPGEVYTDVCAGSAHSCGIRQNGSVWCWGSNSDGQLGRTGAPGGNDPVEAEGGLLFSDVSCGGRHTCGLTRDSALYCWGDNDFGQLGLGETGPVSTPTRVGDRSDWSLFSAGANHNLAVTADGVLFSWGSSEHGRSAHTRDKDVPTPILLPDGQ